MQRGGFNLNGRLAVLAAATALALIGIPLEASAALIPTADLAITKSGSPGLINPGGNVTYTIRVTNAGPDSALSVVVSDVIPVSTTFVALASPPGWTCVAPAPGGSGTVTCSIATLVAGPPQSFTLVVKVNPGTADDTTITNTAAVTSATTDTNQANNTATATTKVKTYVADLSATNVDHPDPVNPATNLTYTITIANAGPTLAQNVRVSDDIPANTTFISLAQSSGPAFNCSAPPVGGTGTVGCTIAASGVSVTARFTLIVKVSEDASDGMFISNTVTVASSTSDPNPQNNSNTAKTAVKELADLSAKKADSPDPVNPATDLTYTLTIANDGPNDAQNVRVSDDIPANTTFVSLAQNSGPAFTCSTPPIGGTGTVGCSIGTFPVYATATFTLVVKVSEDASDGMFICNTVTVASSTTDPNPQNNSDTAKTEVQELADLSVVKADSPDPVSAGNDLSYTVTIANDGPNDAQSVWVNDEIPANTTFVSLTQDSGPPFSCSTPPVGGTGTVGCSLGTFPVYATATFTLIVRVNANTPDGTLICNTVSVQSPTSDPNKDNNWANAKTEVKSSADLSVTKAADVDSVNAGDNLAYTLIVNNPGPSNAQSVAVSDATPANTTFVSLAQNSGPAFTCSTPPAGGTGSITCSIATLDVGVTASFALVVRVNANTPDGSVITNTVTVTSATPDPCPGNNSDTVTTKVKNPPSADLSVTKTDSPDPVTAGANLTYTITVANAGPSDAQSVSVSDATPANTTFVSFTQTGGPSFTLTSPSPGGTGTVTATVPTFAAGASATFSLVVKVNANTPDGTTLSNTATVTSKTSEPVPGNNSATVTTQVNAPPPASADLSVTKTGSPDPVTAGANLTYTLTISNAGPTSAQTVSLSDTIPAHTTFFSLAQSSGPIFTCSTPAVGGMGTVTCSVATLGAGTSAVFALVVKVDADTPDATILTNTVTATSSTSDPNTANNSATATTTVQNVPTP